MSDLVKDLQYENSNKERAIQELGEKLVRVERELYQERQKKDDQLRFLQTKCKFLEGRVETLAFEDAQICEICIKRLKEKRVKRVGV